ncbi:MAG: phosphoserine transaminase [Hyphomicrobiales bacterium]|nr:phosphoserine transaminase [Hyphomicrobiales bacterium]
MTFAKPATRPENPCFSSGPCAKRPGYSLQNLSNAALGRSHRSPAGKAKLKLTIDKTRSVLGIPDDYLIGITAASDTGAFEMAMWSMLGQRAVDVFAWEAFGRDWITDVIKQLRLPDARVFEADYGHLPDLAKANFSRDVIFTWNGTAAGVRVPNGGWIAADRQGLTFCDATSAAFAVSLDWAKLDVTTYSWQKVLGGEAQHGMLILSPRALERLESYTPSWPLPKLFRMTKGGKVDREIFAGSTINTPSMLCVEDYLDALGWAESIGGLPALHARADANAAVIAEWVARTPWVDFLAVDPATRSNTGVTLKFTDASLPAAKNAAVSKQIAAMLDAEGVAYDIASYRDAPPGLRIWCGATVEAVDVAALMPWLDWAYVTTTAQLAKAA